MFTHEMSYQHWVALAYGLMIENEVTHIGGADGTDRFSGHRNELSTYMQKKYLGLSFEYINPPLGTVVLAFESEEQKTLFLLAELTTIEKMVKDYPKLFK